jgi:pilus assembly protein CpaE
VLAAPLEPSFADQISAGEMVKIIEMLRGFCSWVIVDTPAYFNEVVLGIIEESDDVLLIAGMDIPNIKNVKIGLQTLRLLSVPMSKLHLILNRANSKVKLDVGEVERTLQVKAEALIPSDVVVPQSVNKGTRWSSTPPSPGWRSPSSSWCRTSTARTRPAAARPAPGGRGGPDV